MARPISYVTVDIAEFLLEVGDIPPGEHEAWLRRLSRGLALRDPSFHPYGARLLNEVQEYRKAEKARKEIKTESAERHGKRGKTSFPPPSEDSANRHTSKHSSSHPEQGGEGKRAPALDQGFQKPSFEDVKAYCLERGNKIKPTDFLAYYEANGWMFGNHPMRDWKAAIVRWEKRDRDGGGRRG